MSKYTIEQAVELIENKLLSGGFTLDIEEWQVIKSAALQSSNNIKSEMFEEKTNFERRP